MCVFVFHRDFCLQYKTIFRLSRPLYKDKYETQSNLQQALSTAVQGESKKTTIILIHTYIYINKKESKQLYDFWTKSVSPLSTICSTTAAIIVQEIVENCLRKLLILWLSHILLLNRNSVISFLLSLQNSGQVRKYFFYILSSNNYCSWRFSNHINFMRNPSSLRLHCRQATATFMIHITQLCSYKTIKVYKGK